MSSGRALTFESKARVLALILTAWDTDMPSMRLGQLIVCATQDIDLFNVEDTDLAELIDEFAQERTERDANS
jgi:hypothetical protein